MTRQYNTRTVYAADLGHGPEPVRLIELARLWTLDTDRNLKPSPHTRQCWQTTKHGTVAFLAVRLHGTTPGSARPTRALEAATWQPLSREPAHAAQDVLQLAERLADSGLELTLAHRNQQLLGTWAHHQTSTTLGPAATTPGTFGVYLAQFGASDAAQPVRFMEADPRLWALNPKRGGLVRVRPAPGAAPQRAPSFPVGRIALTAAFTGLGGPFPETEKGYARAIARLAAYRLPELPHSSRAAVACLYSLIPELTERGLRLAVVNPLRVMDAGQRTPATAEGAVPWERCRGGAGITDQGVR